VFKQSSWMNLNRLQILGDLSSFLFEQSYLLRLLLSIESLGCLLDASAQYAFLLCGLLSSVWLLAWTTVNCQIRTLCLIGEPGSSPVSLMAFTWKKTPNCAAQTAQQISLSSLFQMEGSNIVSQTLPHLLLLSTSPAVKTMMYKDVYLQPEMNSAPHLSFLLNSEAKYLVMGQFSCPD